MDAARDRGRGGPARRVLPGARLRGRARRAAARCAAGGTSSSSSTWTRGAATGSERRGRGARLQDPDCDPGAARGASSTRTLPTPPTAATPTRRAPRALRGRRLDARRALRRPALAPHRGAGTRRLGPRRASGSSTSTAPRASSRRLPRRHARRPRRRGAGTAEIELQLPRGCPDPRRGHRLRGQRGDRSSPSWSGSRASARANRSRTPRSRRPGRLRSRCYARRAATCTRASRRRGVRAGPRTRGGPLPGRGGAAGARRPDRSLTGTRRTREVVVREDAHAQGGGPVRPRRRGAEPGGAAAARRVPVGRRSGSQDPEVPEETKDVTVDLAERPWRTLAPGVGFSLANGPRAFVEWAQPNLFGRALELVARGEGELPARRLPPRPRRQARMERIEGRADVGLRDPRACGSLGMPGRAASTRIGEIGSTARPTTCGASSTVSGLDIPATSQPRHPLAPVRARGGPHREDRRASPRSPHAGRRGAAPASRGGHDAPRDPARPSPSTSGTTPPTRSAAGSPPARSSGPTRSAARGPDPLRRSSPAGTSTRTC